ncbi:MAG TPA: hypothetical protein VK796_05345 [Cytophaga sp.]|nr:hypothetical protein [Cytophaga sp.]
MSEYKEYFGIFLGGIYAMLFRILGGMELMHGAFTIYSLTFVWVVPLCVGIIPILIARKEMRNSMSKQFFYPFFSGIVFAIMAFSSGLEDIMCLLILAMPFIAGAGTVGLVLGIILDKMDERKEKKK